MESIWAFVAVAIPTVLSLAVGAMQMNREHPKDFVIARACFWLSGLIPAFAVYWWLCHQPLSLAIHVSATFALALITGGLTGALLKWVNEREKHADSEPPAKSEGYNALGAIEQQYQNRPLPPRPDLIAQFTYVGIYGMTAGAGITVRLEIRNAGTPSIADKFTATLSSDGFTDELFPAPIPPDATYADDTGKMTTIKPSETLYHKLRQPIQYGDRVIGFLFYFAKGVSPAQLTAREPTDIVIRFRDVTFREYSVSSAGVKPLYPPGIVDQFAAPSDTEDENESDLLPVNRTHVAIDRLYELGREGKAMLERLRQNQEPIPSTRDVDAWADKLASVASRVGSYGEKTSFKVHYIHLGLPPIVLDVNGIPEANAELAKCIQAKLSLKTALIARLLREDQMKDLMRIPVGIEDDANPLRPIEIRDRLDAFIESGTPVLGRWKGDNDALLTDEIQKESLVWLADVTAFAKKHLSLEQNDKLKDFRMTLTPQEKWPVSHRLTQAGMDPNTFYVAYEMGYKLRILQKFRDEMASPPQEMGKDDRVLIDVADAVNKGTQFFWALLDAKADELSRAELIAVCETLMERGHKNELADFPKEYWLQILREARLSPERPQNELALLDFIWNLAHNLKPTPPS